MDFVSLIHPANSPMVVVAFVAIAFIGIETVRLRNHRRRLASIDVRIHINGSRGKSSVTRLIGAVMRSSGLKAVTKTTGTCPRFIYPNGHEVPIFRAGKPNIIEQLKVVKKTHSIGANVLVTECMAVTPEYISALEDKIIQSTLGIITNVREDHLDVMGPTVYDVAVNLARSLPKNGLAFTAENKWFDVLNIEAKKKGTQLIGFSGGTITDEEMEGFGYIEHKENVALALAVSEHFGVVRNTALEAMYKAEPDPGVLRVLPIRTSNGTIHFYNALAANDPDSSGIIFDNAVANRTCTSIIILISRPDRVQRTEGFAFRLGLTLKADRYILAGNPVAHVAATLRKNGVNPADIITLQNPAPIDMCKTLFDISEGDTVVVAMGNIVGLGDNFVKELEKSASRIMEAVL